jgi:hypothetical protein
MRMWQWYGARGNKYDLQVGDPFTQWAMQGAVYMFVARARTGGLSFVPQPLFIGQTGDLTNRLPQHERWTEALLFGANEIHVLHVKNSAVRAYVERDLILAHRPILNDQLTV